MKEATDTFVAVLGDGTERTVVKGQPFPDRHELVLRDQDPKTGSGSLFRDVNYGEDDEKPPPKSEAQEKPEAAAPVKAAPAKAAGKGASRG